MIKKGLEIGSTDDIPESLLIGVRDYVIKQICQGGDQINCSEDFLKIDNSKLDDNEYKKSYVAGITKFYEEYLEKKNPGILKLMYDDVNEFVRNIYDRKVGIIAIYCAIILSGYRFIPRINL